jgi:hypothetical protein
VILLLNRTTVIAATDVNLIAIAGETDNVEDFRIMPKMGDIFGIK